MLSLGGGAGRDRTGEYVVSAVREVLYETNTPGWIPHTKQQQQRQAGTTKKFGVPLSRWVLTARWSTEGGNIASGWKRGWLRCICVSKMKGHEKSKNIYMEKKERGKERKYRERGGSREMRGEKKQGT